MTKLEPQLVIINLFEYFFWLFLTLYDDDDTDPSAKLSESAFMGPVLFSIPTSFLTIVSICMIVIVKRFNWGKIISLKSSQNLWQQIYFHKSILIIISYNACPNLKGNKLRTGGPVHDCWKLVCTFP